MTYDQFVQQVRVQFGSAAQQLTQQALMQMYEAYRAQHSGG